jgi:glycosyltransferase involved in cell wall biosynthesis
MQAIPIEGQSMNASAPSPAGPSLSSDAPGSGNLDIRHVAILEGAGHPSEANGVHNVARALVREQRAVGEQARLVLLTHGKAAPAADSSGPHQVIYLSGPALRGHTMHMSRDSIDQLLAGAGTGTFCHIHGGREPMLPGLGRSLRRRGIPYAITVHGRFSHVYDPAGRTVKRNTALYLKLFERSLLEGAHFVQALSEEEAAIFRRIAPRARVKIIGNGAYSSSLGETPSTPAPRGVSADYPHFGYCGRYAIAHKGLDLLLEGFASYYAAGGKGRLTMIGTGSAREELTQMAERLGISDRIRILGPSFGAARDALLRECDYFVVPSRFEGVPLAALEAALLGLPLIVTAGSGLRTLVMAEKAGLSIDDHSAAAVAAALRNAEDLGPAEWKARATAAHNVALKQCDWAGIASQLRTEYLGG